MKYDVPINFVYAAFIITVFGAVCTLMVINKVSASYSDEYENFENQNYNLKK